MFKVVSKYKQALHGLPCFVCGCKANGNLAFRKNALKMAQQFMPLKFYWPLSVPEQSKTGIQTFIAKTHRAHELEKNDRTRAVFAFRRAGTSRLSAHPNG
ncbi:MAG: hypothetical protein KF852_14620 [Saprospiraceae bacterium]|nr:hypothetical protein [Saprospiraceae bacterium]